MPGQSHIRFNLMMGWCSLLTISVVIMAIILATTIKNQDSTSKKTNRSTEVSSSNPTVFRKQTGSHSDQPSANHIHLVSEPTTQTWMASESCFCQNTSLILQDSTVTIKVGGFYQTYVQVTFPEQKTEAGSVTLIANENRDGKTPRKLSEVQYNKDTKTITMSTVIHLESGETVKLDFPKSIVFSHEESDTYWGLYLLKKI
uniref:THD domain-containing protein n=1 Tax=Astyanax mexicanus TaxID=7994 RepID=A0A8B9HB90_ASTMX